MEPRRKADRLSGRRADFLATLGVLAPLSFWSAVVLGGALRRGYDHSVRAISELSIGENAPLMNAAFIAYGVLIVIIALGLRPVVLPTARIGLVLLTVAGAATAGLGIQWIGWASTTGAPSLAPPAADSLTTDAAYDVIHDLLAILAYLSSALAALLAGLGLRGQPAWRGYDTYFVASGVLALALMAYAGLGHVSGGVVQRSLTVTVQLWVAVIALRSRGALRSVPAAVPA